MHFQQLFLNFYPDKSMDFSADVTALVRSLGIVDLLTLVFGLTIGAAMSLTITGRSVLVRGTAKGAAQLDEFEEALVTSGLVNVAKIPEGTTYQVTEKGRRFLREFAYLRRLEEETIPYAQTRSVS